MKVTAEMIEKLSPLYQERLESELISELSSRLGLDASDAMKLYYESRLAREIDEGAYGIQYLSPGYLVDELLLEIEGNAR